MCKEIALQFKKCFQTLDSGLSGLQWSTVWLLIEQRLSGLHNTNTIIYELDFSPDPAAATHDGWMSHGLVKGKAGFLVLIERYLSAFGLELFTTVHWLAGKERLDTTPSVISAVHSWNARKGRFPDQAIEKAIERLSDSDLIALAE